MLSGQLYAMQDINSFFIACANRGDIARIKTLLNAGANVNTRGLFGNTPLHRAIINNRHEVSQFLINNFADVNAQNNQGETPLHCAAESGQYTIAQLLINKHADVNTQTILKERPLHRAAENGHYEVVQLLLSNHADVIIKDFLNNTPMNLAATNCHSEISYLFEHWKNIKQGMHTSWLRSILASQHQRCGANSTFKFHELPMHVLQDILYLLNPKNCAYSHDQVKMYVALFNSQKSNKMFETCAICLEYKAKNQMITPGNCTHLFCASCLQSYACTQRRVEYADGTSAPIINSTCPLCHAPVDMNKIDQK